MEYKQIQYVDKPISDIVFGCANPMIMNKPSVFQEPKVMRLLDEAMENGINTFDVAENYGVSEIVLGRWIKKRKRRNDIVIITKGCHPHGEPRVNTKALKEDIEQSFKRLQTDYIDIYMLHRDAPDADVKAIVDVLNEYHNKGKIGAFGASNWTHGRIAEANIYAKQNGLQPFSVSSPNFGPAEQVSDPWGGGCVTISGSENKEAREWYLKEQIPVFAYSCLGRGLFSGKVKTDDAENTKKNLDKFAVKGYWSEKNLNRLSRVEQMARDKGCSVAQVSLAWIMSQAFEVFPIVTISNYKRIKENAEAVSLKLSQEEVQFIEGN